jgi:hypothetical protein
MVERAPWTVPVDSTEGVVIHDPVPPENRRSA